MKTKLNPLNIAAKEKARKESREKYLRLKLILILTGTLLFVIGAGAFAIERARIEGGKTETELVESSDPNNVSVETTDNDKQSRLAYLYNTLPMLGAAILSALAFHIRAKRNLEIDRIADLDEQLEQTRIQRLDLLAELEGDDNGHSNIQQGFTRDNHTMLGGNASDIAFSRTERNGTTGSSDRSRPNG